MSWVPMIKLLEWIGDLIRESKSTLIYFDYFWLASGVALSLLFILFCWYCWVYQMLPWNAMKRLRTDRKKKDIKEDQTHPGITCRWIFWWWSQHKLSMSTESRVFWAETSHEKNQSLWRAMVWGPVHVKHLNWTQLEFMVSRYFKVFFVG